MQVTYCTGFDCDESSELEETDGWVQTSKLWKTRDKIKVHFLTPKVLEGWKIGSTTNRMTVDDILSWAAEWTRELVPAIPKFVKTDSAEESDIRVAFKGESISV